MPALKPARMTRTYRGQKFILEEVDTEVYDDCVTKATKQVLDPITGRETDDVDENLALRLLIRVSVKSPKITDWNTLGTRLTRQLERDVRELHFGLEPDEETKKKKALATADEDDDSPNRSD